MKTFTELRVNGQRLWESLQELATIGATEKGGVCRLALTELDGQGRRLVEKWARDLGCTVRVDQVGNIFMQYAGTDANRPPIMTGSHIDTQPTGGKYDGNYGVLAGIEVLRTLHDAKVRLPAPIEVAVWTNEEGSRFIPVMMGSGAFIQRFTVEHVWQQADLQGITVQEALKSIDYLGTEPVGGRTIGAYFEAHIEQGPILENKATTIGVVTAALGQRWYDIIIQGMEAHAGPTPMELRKDALLAASHLIQRVNQIAIEHAPHARGTVGWIDNFPNSRNVIPGKVRCSIDFRAADDDTLTQMAQKLQVLQSELERQYGVTVEVQPVVYFPPQPFDPALVASIRAEAATQGYTHLDIVSGAGHDAVYLAQVAPTAMIFIPCKDGISHNEIEDALPADIEAGANVLLQAMIKAAQ